MSVKFGFCVVGWQRLRDGINRLEIERCSLCLLATEPVFEIVVGMYCSPPKVWNGAVNEYTHPPYSTLLLDACQWYSGIVKWRCVAVESGSPKSVTTSTHRKSDYSTSTDYTIMYVPPFPLHPLPTNNQVVKIKGHLSRDWRDLTT